MQSVNPFLKVMVKGYRFLLPINPEQHNSDVRWESIKSDLLKSLTHRPFALLWSGQTVSRLGDSLYRIAMAWWVLEETGSAAPKGTVLVFSTVPMLIFLLFGSQFSFFFYEMQNDSCSNLRMAVYQTMAL